MADRQPREISSWQVLFGASAVAFLIAGATGIGGEWVYIAAIVCAVLTVIFGIARRSTVVERPARPVARQKKWRNDYSRENGPDPAAELHNLTPDQWEEIHAHLANKQQIAAIKALRKHTGLGLREARKLIVTLER